MCSRLGTVPRVAGGGEARAEPLFAPPPAAPWGRQGAAEFWHNEEHDFFGSGPVVGFAVDPFAAARAALVSAGIEFIYPEPQRQGGRAWQHFRAPDGNIYEIIGPDDIDQIGRADP